MKLAIGQQYYEHIPQMLKSNKKLGLFLQETHQWSKDTSDAPNGRKTITSVQFESFKNLKLRRPLQINE